MGNKPGDIQTCQRANALMLTEGQSATEFAASLFTLALFLMIVFDFGRGLYAYSVISAAAQEGARYGLIHPEDTVGIQNAARSRVVGLEPSSLIIGVTWPESNVIAVTITYEFQVVTPLIGRILGNQGRLRLEATAAMRQ